MATRRKEQVQDQLAARTRRALDRGITAGGRTKMSVVMRAAILKPKLKDALVENNGNVAAAAAEVGVTTSYANKLMPDVRRELMAELEEKGVTASKVAQVVSDALDANKVVTHEGYANETDVPDHSVRMNAAKFTTKITGATAPQRSVHLNLNEPVPEEAEPGRVSERLKVLNEFAPELEAIENVG